jgi:hypothetical protein
MTKNLPQNLIWLMLAILAMGLAGPAPPAAGGLKPAGEAALYSLADLGPVDLSPKTVQVEVYAVPAPELEPFVNMLPAVWAKVQQFYARLGVTVVRAPGRARPGPLAPAERLRLEALPHKEWLNRSCAAFAVPPPLRLSFMAVCRNKFAFAHLPLSVIHFSYRRFEEALFSAEAGADELNRRVLANLIVHELGHLMGLYHAHEFKNDAIPELLPDGKTPNFMSHYLTNPGELGFTPLQKQLVHSYLGQGKVFEQYRRVDFDPLRYLELIKKHNGYQEPVRERKSEAN